MCFHWFFFQREEYDQEHAASRRGSDSNEIDMFMYARIKFDVKWGFSVS